MRLLSKLRYSNRPVVFVDCPLDSSVDAFHEKLGVERIPFVQLYHKGGLLMEQQVTRRNFSVLEQDVQNAVVVVNPREQESCRDENQDMRP